MAAAVRRKEPSLEQTLFEAPYRFDFFQAVRLLERSLPPGGTPLGRDGPPSRESVRFFSRLALSFPPSALDRLEPPSSCGGPAALTVNFFGLTGASGVLPYVYTELLQAGARTGETAPAAFFDLINHRLVSLFYRAWEKHRVALDVEAGNGGRFAGHVFALMGLGLPSHRERHTFSDHILLKYAAFFAQQQRPAVVLEGLLRDHSGLKVEVVQFAGRWLALDPADRSTLGGRNGQNALGVTLMLGNRVWDEAGQIRLRLGPLSYAQFRDYLPDRKGFRSLVELARLFVGTGFNLDVQLVLSAPEVPACRLSSDRGAEAGARLGRDAWVRSRQLAHDAHEAVFRARV
jgi:type VI secretion system protein ImpH